MIYNTWKLFSNCQKICGDSIIKVRNVTSQKLLYKRLMFESIVIAIIKSMIFAVNHKCNCKERTITLTFDSLRRYFL